MPFNITYNDSGEIKIIENGEVKDELNLQWEKNSIDKSILNNINRAPKVLVGERIGLETESEETTEVSQYSIEVEINGSNFITDDSQNVLISPIVTEIDSGNIIDDDKYNVNWYLNGNLLDVPNIFELNTEQLNNEANNIIKLEVIIGDEVMVDKASILKYLGFTSADESNDNGGGSNGDSGNNGGGSSGGDGGSDERNQESKGEVLNIERPLEIVPLGNGFKVGEEISFKVKADTDACGWTFGDGNSKEGRDVTYNYDEKGIYMVKATFVKDSFDYHQSIAKIKIVE